MNVGKDNPRFGVIETEGTRLKKSSSMKSRGRVGDKCPEWKGDKVKYSGLHKWVTKNLGSPNECSVCNCLTKKRYEWASIDHKYKRNLNDWIRVCCSCHYEYDIENNLRVSRKIL